MAKWDLSKLPEGRKPLPDEWFAERAQMQERIKELEAKLAKAVEALRTVEKHMNDLGGYDGRFTIRKSVSATLAELTGGKDD